MYPLQPKVIEILNKYVAAPAQDIDTSAPLSDLDIDCLDIPMIFLDIEDAFNVQILGSDETDPSLTVDGLIACVAARLDAKHRAANRPVIRRPKRTWVSTGADR